MNRDQGPRNRETFCPHGHQSAMAGKQFFTVEALICGSFRGLPQLAARPKQTMDLRT
jgi:hypothetical protein